jgi:branched-chain amino acid transport system substrate-binding protein
MKNFTRRFTIAKDPAVTEPRSMIPLLPMWRAAMATAAVLLASHAAAQTAEPLRIGIITELSGASADSGRQAQQVIELYMKQNGDTVAGRKVEVLFRDAPGASPELARRDAQSLIARDKVDFIGGFGLTPNAIAVAPIVTAAKKPMIIMNTAATSVITTMSPFIQRMSFTLPQVTQPLAEWAAKNGVKTVYTIVTDFGPGVDAEKTFVRTFEALGGKVVGTVRTPLANPEFGPFLQRARDAKPDAIFSFNPGGDQAVQFVKAYSERGLAKDGIKLLTTGDIVDDAFLDKMGEAALGLISSHHYSMAHDSPANKAYVAAYKKAYGADARTSFYGVGSWDGMAAIYEVARRLNGPIDGEKAMKILCSLKLESPRGPISFDENCDIVQNVYIRRVEKRDGQLYNIEFATFAGVKDPGKAK